MSGGDTGMLNLFGEPAQGKQPNRSARRCLKSKFPGASVAYEIPNASVGYEPGLRRRRRRVSPRHVQRLQPVAGDRDDGGQA